MYISCIERRLIYLPIVVPIVVLSNLCGARAVNQSIIRFYWVIDSCALTYSLRLVIFGESYHEEIK